MKIKNTTNSKKITIIALATIAIVCIGYFSVAAAYKLYPFQGQSKPSAENVNDVDYGEATEEQQNAPTEMTEEGSKNLPKENQGSSINVVITSSQLDPSGSLRIGTLIQTLSGAGECTLSVKKDGQEIDNQKVEIQALSNASTCKGFTVASNKLTPGKYTITVIYMDGDMKGSVQGEVIVP